MTKPHIRLSTRDDGYLNALTGVGTQRDPTTQTWFAPELVLTQPTLEAIFEGDGIGRRIVEMPAEEMCRGWFDVIADEGEGVQDYLETLRAQQAFTDGVVWSRLYGGSVAYILLDDGRDDAMPVRPDAIKSFLGIQIFDRFSVAFEPLSLSQDRLRRLQGLPEIYLLTPPSGGGQVVNQLRVHESRIVYLPGRRLDIRRRTLNGGWDSPVLQSAYTVLQRWGAGMGYANNILRDFVQAVLAVKDLTAMIASGREEVVQRRIRLLDVSRSILNTMVIDGEGEEYSKSASSVAGLADILDRFGEALSAAVGIPVAKLFGRSAGGLNSTGEHDLKNYYDMLAAEQNRVLDPLAEAVVKFIFLAKDGPTGGKEPKKWSVRWRSLDEPTEKETAELRKAVADADALYITNGVLSPEEVAESRFGRGEWSMETKLLGAERNPVASMSPEDAAALVAQTTAPTEGEEPPARGDAAPRSLYVSRKLLNAAAVIKWAKGQGLVGLHDASDLHVTITYSRTPVDWMQMGESWSGELRLQAGGPRVVEQFDLGAIVLSFRSSELEWRHQSMLDRGATSDYDKYQPHITLTYTDQDISDVTPYTGELIFGPEIFEEIRD